MKIFLIALTCLLFTIGNAFSEEGLISPSTPAPAKEVGNIPGETPSGLSEGAITPQQVKEFLSRPGKTAKSADDDKNYIILNFDNADLKDVINTIGSITNENFIMSPGVDARITIHSAKKIPVSEVMSVFESVLEVNGISLVRSGDFLKVVAGAAAKQKPLEVRKGDAETLVPDIDRPVTQIIPVKYVPVTEVSAVLTPMLSQFGSIIPNTRSNLLIVNDLSSSIVRLLKVLKEIDVNAFQNTRMSFFKPKYSDVQTLSSELTEVLTALKLTGDGIALVPIERINSLVVFSSSPTLLKTVEGWMRKLDEEVMTGQNVFIYPVQNVEADSIASVLNSLYVTGQSSGSKTVARISSAAEAKKTTTKRTISSPTAQPTGSRIEIMTFEPTNSLVILAPPGLYREMVETIKRIDVYPREVLIEAIIAQVTLSDSEKLGVQWSVIDTLTIDNKEFVTRTQSLSDATDIPALSGEAPALAGKPFGGLSFVLFRADKLAAMINALSSESQVNILSSPRLLVRDREEAYIEVGSDVPTATSTSSVSDTVTQSIEYRTVGIKLKIKPTINEERTVVLDVEQEVSSTGDNISVGAEGTTFPSFNTTKAKTSIVVPDKQGIIIGGIMEQTEGESFQGVPFLSSIPLFGSLFKYSVDTMTKKELIIIINPHVVTSPTEADQLTKQFMTKLKNIKELLKDNEDKISLPDLDEKDPPKTDEP
ncbi:MAG: type II secretion system secretin GspD [Nitrospira sp.]|nr:type II secretion system secretin GspD [Nitrospira sp.]